MAVSGVRLRKLSNIYSKAIMSNIGIFIFIGFIELLFGTNGWFPNGDIYAISRFVQTVILPAFLAYGIGRAFSEQSGGILAAMAVTGVIAAEPSIGIAGAFFAGSMAGFLWKKVFLPIKPHIKAGMELLYHNFAAAFGGILLALVSYYLIAPMLTVLTDFLETGIEFFIERKLLIFLGVVIEPLKILFLNNVVNYGLLIPLGMQQVEKYGSSVLFLLEANPGPGLGILLAYLVTNREKRKEYAMGAIMQAVGGIHEIYFPLVYEKVWLLVPLMLGNMMGMSLFYLLGAALNAPAAPGSILTILFMAASGSFFSVLLGVAGSAAVSMGVTLLVFKFRKKEVKVKQMEQTEKKQMFYQVRKIAFVCDGGIGSSVMGASLLRRKLKEKQAEGVTVTSCAADGIPEDADFLVCQKDYEAILKRETGDTKKIVTVKSLLDMGELEQLADKIKEGQGA